MSPSSDGDGLLRLERVTRGALGPVSFTLAAGETVKVIAGSREAAEELLGILGGQFLPGSGRVELFGQETAALPEGDRLALLTRVGFVPENGGLISNLKAWENLVLPATYHREETPAGLESRVSALGKRFGIPAAALAAMLGKLPDRLSVLERRQVALLRAALMKPSLYVFDYLHAGLDRAAGESLLAAAGVAGSAAGVLHLCPDDAVSARISADRSVRLGAEGS
jgi:predicted ABC-type transport system involved in lysophospholipase L1 biosynthesis ATPase subunit